MGRYGAGSQGTQNKPRYGPYGMLCGVCAVFALGALRYVASPSGTVLMCRCAVRFPRCGSLWIKLYLGDEGDDADAGGGLYLVGSKRRSGRAGCEPRPRYFTEVLGSPRSV